MATDTTLRGQGSKRKKMEQLKDFSKTDKNFLGESVHLWLKNRNIFENFVLDGGFQFSCILKNI